MFRIVTVTWKTDLLIIMTFQDEILAILVRGGDYVSLPSVGL
jgi:hypothetical protein